MKRKLGLRNKRGAISLFVLLSVLFFLVIVTGVATSTKNKETKTNAEIARVKAIYEKDIGNEQQIYNKKVQQQESNKKKLTINPNGGTWRDSTEIATENQDEGTELNLGTPTPPSVTFNLDGGALKGEEPKAISFKEWQLKDGDPGELSGNTYTFGNGNATITAIYNNTPVTLPDAEKSGYIFAGWFKDTTRVGGAESNYTPKGAVTLTAHWTEESTTNIELAFIDASGEEKHGTPNPLVLHENQTSGTVTTPEIADYTGYTTKYWAKGTTPDSPQVATSGGTLNNVSENGTYYAVYQKQVEVNFNLDGATGTPPETLTGNVKVNSSNLSNISGTNITLPTETPTKQGYKFAGWKSSEDNKIYNAGATYTSKTGATMTAQWTIHSSSLTINPGDGGKVKVKSPETSEEEEISASKTYTQDYNTTLKYETPTKADTTDTTTKYTVTYNTDGGSTAPANQDATITKVTGYTFDGWTKSSGFKGTLNETTKIYTFPADDDNTDTITATYTGTVKSTEVASVTLGAAPTKEGYTFTGWKSSTNNQTYNAGASYTPTANTTMTAQWTANTSKLTIDPDGGKVKVKSPSTADEEEISENKTYTQDNNTTLTYKKPTKADTIDTSTKYTVTYNTDGGSTAPTNQDATITIVTGYTFKEWTKSAGFKGTLSEIDRIYTFPADNNTDTITATYTSHVKSTTVASVTLEAAPTKENYDFAGWKSSSNNQVYQAGANYTPTANTTMTAQWTIKKHKVTFMGNEGTPNEQYMYVEHNTAIGTLPTASRTNYGLNGWYTAPSGGTQITASTKVTTDITYYAQWVSATARIGDTFYGSLTDAINAVPATQTKTTIVLLKDTSGKFTINAKQYIDFDLQNFTISNKGNTSIIENSGNITISNGNILSSAASKTVPVIKNKSGGSITINSTNVETKAAGGGRTIENDGTFTINGGTIKTISTGEQAIENTSTGTITIAGGSVIAEGSKHGIRNYGGRLYIKGGTINSVVSTSRAAVHNTSDGTLEITGGTIISNPKGKVSDQGGYAVYVENGTCVIGTSGGNLDRSSPVIQGIEYGVNTKVDISFYDGIIKGSTKAAINDTTKITDKETGYDLVEGRETINNAVYKTLYLAESARVTFNPNNGTVSETERIVEKGKAIGDLPEGTRTGYIFKGWFTDPDDGEEVTKNTIITKNETFYAHWAKSIKITLNKNTSDVNANIIIESVYVEAGQPIGPLPEATRTGYIILGWFTDPNNGTLITEETPAPSADVTYYAHWQETNPAAIGDTEYGTLQEAVNAAGTSNTPVTITILENTTEQLTIAAGQNIIFDLGGNSLSNNGKKSVIENKGTITFTSGTLSSSDGAEASTINNYAGGTVTIDGIDIIATGERQAIYNYGGTIIIKGNSVISSNTHGFAPANQVGSNIQRGTIQNFAGGTVTIEAGTIIATETYAIVNTGTNSTVTLGKKDGSVNISSPMVVGNTYGVKNTETLNFYDGTIKGKTAAIEGTPTEEEENTHEVNDTEVIDEDTTYLTLHLEANASMLNNAAPNSFNIPARVSNTLGKLVATKKSRIVTIIVTIIILLMIVLFIRTKNKKKRSKKAKK